MKTDVEELSPTRVRLTIEVPFDELKPSLDHAYREVGRQVRIPGFRPGHVPRQVLDQRVGRGAVLEHAINEAVPDFYSQAVRENKLAVLSQPELEITKLEDGNEIAFTAEVDVRPKFDLPEMESLHVVVEDADVSPDQVEEYLRALRERFGSLITVERPAEDGDYVSIDLSAQVDGEEVADAQATGISYEVGSGTILDGLDQALMGMSAEETATFESVLAGGEHEGSAAEVTVTVRSVRTKNLPDLDDDFAQSASEFNTVGELRSNTRKQMEAMRRAGQVGQARDRAIEALLEQIDMPLPQPVIDHEVAHRHESLTEDLDRAGLTMELFLQSRDLTPADLDKEIADDVRRSVKARFILDKLAETEELDISQEDLAQYVTQLAYQQGTSPDALASQLAESGQLGAMAADVLRSKAADLLAERVQVFDESGRKVEIAGAGAPGDEAQDEEAQGEDGDEDSEAAKEGRAGRRGAGRRAAAKEAKVEAAAKPKGRSRRAGKEEAAQADQAGEPADTHEDADTDTDTDTQEG